MYMSESRGEVHQNAQSNVLLETARSLSESNSRLPRALLTDVELPLEIKGLFNCILAPKAMQPLPYVHHMSSWQLLSYSPFIRTLVMPINTTTCADLMPVCSMLDHHDILVAPFLEAPYIDPTSTIAFRAGQGFNAFLDTLERILPFASDQVAVDLAMRTLDYDSIKVGVLPGNWRLRLFHHSYGSDATFYSFPLSGDPVYAIEGCGRKDLCTWINGHPLSSNRDGGRILVMNGTLLSKHNLLDQAQCNLSLSADICDQEGMSQIAANEPVSFWSHSIQHQREFEHTRALRSKLAAQGLSYGVSYFGYSTDPDRLVRYIAEVEKAAWSFKLYNPQTRIALFTNQPMLPRPPFNDIVHMKDKDIKPVCCKRNESWNILARVQYHGQSPYNMTVQIDSDRVVHGDVSPIFEWLAADYDLLGVSGGGLPDVDLGVFGLRKNERTEALLEAWVAKMKQLGHEGVDDQFSFTRVRNSIPGLRMGFLNPRWQMKYTPPKPFSHALCNSRKLDICNVTHTLVMRGDVVIGTGSYLNLDQLISRTRTLNREETRAARVFVHDLLTEKYVEAGTRDACMQLTRNQCDHPELDWDLDDYDVLNSGEVSRRYPNVDWRVN